MGLPPRSLALLPWLRLRPIAVRWSLGQSRGPDIGHEKMPPDLAKIAGGNGSWVKDTSRFLASSSLDSISSMAVIDTLSSSSGDLSSSPMSSSAGSSIASSLDSRYNLFANGYKSSFAAPMLSPASSTDSLDFFGPPGATFLDRVFPDSTTGRHALPVDSKSLQGWSLAVVEDETSGDRTVYAQGQCGFESMCSRENVISLLDFADEELEGDQVVVVLDKKDSDLASLLHSLMYIGGVVIPPNKSTHADNFVLVGLEL